MRKSSFPGGWRHSNAAAAWWTHPGPPESQFGCWFIDGLTFRKRKKHALSCSSRVVGRWFAALNATRRTRSLSEWCHVLEMKSQHHQERMQQQRCSQAWSWLKWRKTSTFSTMFRFYNVFTICTTLHPIESFFLRVLFIILLLHGIVLLF